MCRYADITPDQIGFDIDCVVADTMEAFIRICAVDYGITVFPGQITSFMVESCLPIDQEIIDSIFSRLLAAPLENGLQPVADAVSVLTEFARHAPLTFITARPHADPIDGWLRSVLPESAYVASRLIATGDHDGKAHYLRRLGLRFFVDDRLETCVDLAREGFCPVVFSQPWNVGLHSLASVDCWRQIRSMVNIDA